jgi:hypothetical protein
MVHAHAGFIALWQPVALSVLALAVVAVIWSRVYEEQFVTRSSGLTVAPFDFLGIWDD